MDSLMCMSMWVVDVMKAHRCLGALVTLSEGREMRIPIDIAPLLESAQAKFITLLNATNLKVKKPKKPQPTKVERLSDYADKLIWAEDEARRQMLCSCGRRARIRVVRVLEYLLRERQFNSFCKVFEASDIKKQGSLNLLAYRAHQFSHYNIDCMHVWDVLYARGWRNQRDSNLLRAVIRTDRGLWRSRPHLRVEWLLARGHPVNGPGTLPRGLRDSYRHPGLGMRPLDIVYLIGDFSLPWMILHMLKRGARFYADRVNKCYSWYHPQTYRLLMSIFSRLAVMYTSKHDACPLPEDMMRGVAEML